MWGGDSRRHRSVGLLPRLGRRRKAKLPALGHWVGPPGRGGGCRWPGRLGSPAHSPPMRWALSLPISLPEGLVNKWVLMGTFFPPAEQFNGN